MICYVCGGQGSEEAPLETLQCGHTIHKRKATPRNSPAQCTHLVPDSASGCAVCSHLVSEVSNVVCSRAASTFTSWPANISRHDCSSSASGDEERQDEESGDESDESDCDESDEGDELANSEADASIATCLKKESDVFTMKYYRGHAAALSNQQKQLKRSLVAPALMPNSAATVASSKSIVPSCACGKSARPKKTTIAAAPPTTERKVCKNRLCSCRKADRECNEWCLCCKNGCENRL